MIMDRFKKIALLYSANSDDKIVLKRAAALAEINKAKVLAINVGEPMSAAVQFLLGKERSEQYEADRQRNIETRLSQDLSKLELATIPLNYANGDTTIECIRFILKNKCDLLMKVRDVPSKKQTISVTDMKLLRKCPVPVMLLKPGRKKSFSRIMAAIDLGPENAPSRSLVTNILKLATSLSEREGAELDILHAWQTFSKTTLQGPRFKMSTAEIEELAGKEKQLRETWMEEALISFQDIKVKMRRHLIEGDPAEVITEFSNKRRTDLLIMGSLARGGLQGLLIGNTAERVLDTVNCSTLTIKPDDFICPIKN